MRKRRRRRRGGAEVGHTEMDRAGKGRVGSDRLGQTFHAHLEL